MADTKKPFGLETQPFNKKLFKPSAESGEYEDLFGIKTPAKDEPLPILTFPREKISPPTHTGEDRAETERPWARRIQRIQEEIQGTPPPTTTKEPTKPPQTAKDLRTKPLWVGKLGEIQAEILSTPLPKTEKPKITALVTGRDNVVKDFDTAELYELMDRIEGIAKLTEECRELYKNLPDLENLDSVKIETQISLFHLEERMKIILSQIMKPHTTYLEKEEMQKAGKNLFKDAVSLLRTLEGAIEDNEQNQIEADTIEKIITRDGRVVLLDRSLKTIMEEFRLKPKYLSDRNLGDIAEGLKKYIRDEGLLDETGKRVQRELVAIIEQMEEEVRTTTPQPPSETFLSKLRKNNLVKAAVGFVAGGLTALLINKGDKKNTEIPTDDKPSAPIAARTTEEIKPAFLSDYLPTTSLLLNSDGQSFDRSGEKPPKEIKTPPLEKEIVGTVTLGAETKINSAWGALQYFAQHDKELSKKTPLERVKIYKSILSGGVEAPGGKTFFYKFSGAKTEQPIILLSGAILTLEKTSDGLYHLKIDGHYKIPRTPLVMGNKNTISKTKTIDRNQPPKEPATPPSPTRGELTGGTPDGTPDKTVGGSTVEQGQKIKDPALDAIRERKVSVSRELLAKVKELGQLDPKLIKANGTSNQEVVRPLYKKLLKKEEASTLNQTEEDILEVIRELIFLRTQVRDIREEEADYLEAIKSKK